jgi:hypothetical protein
MNSTATTKLEEDRQYAKLPEKGNKSYLRPKADTAMKVPEIRSVVKASGEEYTLNLRQVTMSGLIRADEAFFDYLWYYKAEVSFDMPDSMKGVPKPFLSQTSKDLNRRHHLTPFPKGGRKGHLRRPDLIIVKDKNIRWPGRAATNHENQPHPDNLRRVVEIKFPKDNFAEKQMIAYEQIAGGRDRPTLLHVSSKSREKAARKAAALKARE